MQYRTQADMTGLSFTEHSCSYIQTQHQHLIVLNDKINFNKRLILLRNLSMKHNLGRKTTLKSTGSQNPQITFRMLRSQASSIPNLFRIVVSTMILLIIVPLLPLFVNHYSKKILLLIQINLAVVIKTISRKN